MNPAANAGDLVRFKYAGAGGKGKPQKLYGKVLKVKKDKKSQFLYKIALEKSNLAENVIKVRMGDISDFKVKKKGSAVPQESTAYSAPPTHVVGGSIDCRYILAPMVGASELPFRLLCRRYGASLAYTPMINSERFAEDPDYRRREFQCTPEDRPLVVHFSANKPDAFLKAARFVEDACDAIDLNLGCPQRVAAQGHFGSFLLDEADRPLVLKMVRTLSSSLSIPVFVKIRLLSTLPETIRLVEQLRDAGAALVAIHARHRVDLTKRSGPGARDGPALLDQVTAIKEAVSGVQIISNGNIKTFEDVQANLASTRADGVMSAEGILDDPALFAPAVNKSVPDKLSLAREYLDLVAAHPAPLKSVVFHLRRMARQELTDFQLLDDLLRSQTVEEARGILEKAWEFQRNPASFTYDPKKESREKEALARKKHEEGKRKRYEERMQRKAKREGKALDFYLQAGMNPPTQGELETLRAMGKDERFAAWKKVERFRQHCFAFHLGEDGCARDRACSFLHVDPTFGAGPMQGEAFG